MSKMKSLIIEGDLDSRSFLKEAMQRRGYSVTVLSEEQLELGSLGAQEFDLIVFDWRLPAKVRENICQRLTSSSRDRRFFTLVVGMGSEPYSWQQALSAGADDLMSLPHDSSRLEERLAVAEHQIRKKSVRTTDPDPPHREVSQKTDTLIQRLTNEELQLPAQQGADRSAPVSDAAAPVLEEKGQLYKKAQLFTLDSIWRAEKGQAPELEQGIQLVGEMLDSMQGKSTDLLLSATDRGQEYSVSAHSVNVAILSLRVGRTLKLNAEKLLRVGLASLLHEVGVVTLPSHLLHKTGRMSDQEVSAMRERPLYSAEILRRLGPEQAWLCEIVAQVFEREDGSGFPKGLMGHAILQEAKVIGITDVFEACIHNRPYRSGLTGYQLLHELTTEGTQGFSHSIVKSLIQTFSLYPYNEHVVLNTGEVGKVIDVEPGNLSRPVIRILYSEEGERLADPKVIRLSKHPSLYITKAIYAEAISEAG